MKRCAWVGLDTEMIKYHDKEWGVPVHNDRKLFEFFVLDAFQAGLSWAIVLKKRNGFRKAFHNFDYKKIAKYTEKDVNRLISNEEIIRNRLKIASAVTNAQKFIEVRKEFGTFDNYIWSFVDKKTIKNEWTLEIPARSVESDAMSAALRSRGFRFVGSTICYAFMQAAGLVNDHTTDCFRHREVYCPQILRREVLTLPVGVC
jgi:DNA-3-methyladenine glycosylase I